MRRVFKINGRVRESKLQFDWSFSCNRSRPSSRVP